MEYDHLILLCGHYEGVDQRVIDEIVDEELSIGDYVLTGGELAACVVIDATLRLLPGVLPHEEAHIRESHTNGLLNILNTRVLPNGVGDRLRMCFCQVTKPTSKNGNVCSLCIKLCSCARICSSS